MIDNIKLAQPFEPPNELNNANGKPFEYFGNLYIPRYLKGNITSYEATVKNMRIIMYPAKIYAVNSLHKYWHNGSNYDDFTLDECRQAVTQLCQDTGINWHSASVQKIEWGCNVITDAQEAINSLLSYKGKEYLPMICKSKKYGMACEFIDYKIKVYNKSWQVQQLQNFSLPYPVLRWEIAVSRMRIIEKLMQASLLTMQQLLTNEAWQTMAQHALTIFQHSIKKQKMMLEKLDVQDKKTLAAMLVPEIRYDLRKNHKDTYKRAQKLLKKVMNDRTFNGEDLITETLKKKFEELMPKECVIKKQFQTCNIVGNRMQLCTSPPF